VSRVGGAAQTKLIKKLAGGVRLALAQYRELAAFSQFMSDLDDATRKQLERGQRIMEIMKQKQYMPLSIAEMAVILYAADNGFLDDVPLAELAAFEKGLQGHLRTQQAEFMKQLNQSGDYNDEIAKTLRSIVEAYKKTH
jgi:F-type H+-transporting ATPase subunit alpha